MISKLLTNVVVLFSIGSLVGCTTQQTDALGVFFGGMNQVTSPWLQAEQDEKQQLMQAHEQALQNNAAQQRARDIQRLCMNPVNRQSPVCRNPQ
jgi:hypothetical protein